MSASPDLDIMRCEHLSAKKQTHLSLLSRMNLWGCHLRSKRSLSGRVTKVLRTCALFFTHTKWQQSGLLSKGIPDHDIRFYNVLEQAKAQGQTVHDVFNDPFWYFKHALIDKAHLCDTIFAVGDLVVDELRFLAKPFEDFPINLVYNGIPAFAVTLQEKLRSKALLQKYAATLLDYRPDYVFTHVTRLVKSKGLWRDLQVLNHLDALLASNDKTAVLFILSTEIATGRPYESIYGMEHEYGWPVHHKIGYPDLVGAEVELNNGVSAFQSAV